MKKKNFFLSIEALSEKCLHFPQNKGTREYFLCDFEKHLQYILYLC